uniref:Putative secreted protein n=1 Tax=Anopheles darlingi TaxID=43151 RepID=A0A2M4D088_ANODA
MSCLSTLFVFTVCSSSGLLCGPPTSAFHFHRFPHGSTPFVLLLRDIFERYRDTVTLLKVTLHYLRSHYTT